MINKLIEKYETLLNTLRENKKIADSTDLYPYNLDIKNTREYLKDLKKLKEQLTIPVVVSSEITFSDIGQEFVIIRDDLVEIEKGSEVVLLTINSNGRHEFMDKNTESYWFEADCVKRKRVI